MSNAYSSYFGFENLEVYKLSLDLVAEIYTLTESFPKSEQFGLTNQLQRAANSVCLNIAEGRGRDSDKEFRRYLNIARGSVFEIVSGLHIAVRLKYIPESAIEAPLANASRMKAKINALVKSLEVEPPQGV